MRTSPALCALRGATIAAVIALAVLAACDDGRTPTRPSAPPSPQPSPVTVTRLEITGPDTIQPAENVQYSATAHQSNGSTRDVTSEVSWRTPEHLVLTISPTGLATGLAPGEAFISATGISASGGPWSSGKNVIVLPAGTYRLAGTVRDAGHPVCCARVEINRGTGRGLGSSTDLLGQYRVYGVAGDIEVLVFRNGFQTLRRTLQVTSHQTVDFDLELSRPRTEVSGTYTLTVSAAPECRTALPEHARTRSYNAVVTQDGPKLAVTLGGAKFYTEFGRTYNGFRGDLEPGTVIFQVGSHSYYYGTSYEVIEELDSSTFLAITGHVISTFAEGRISGALHGSIETLRPATGGLEKIATCQSATHAHPFELSR